MHVQSLAEFLAAQKASVAKSVELRAVRATQRPAKERTDDPAQVMFTRWTAVHHVNIQSLQKLLMGCRADQQALLDAQVRKPPIMIRAQSCVWGRGAVAAIRPGFFLFCPRCGLLLDEDRYTYYVRGGGGDTCENRSARSSAIWARR